MANRSAGRANAVSWTHLMRFGLGALSLPPQAFWALTVPELRAAIAWHFPPAQDVPDRSWLEAAIRTHPDASPPSGAYKP